MAETPRNSRSQAYRRLSLAEKHDKFVNQYSRRTLFRVGAVSGAALAAGGVLLPGAAAASPGPTVLLNADKVAGSALRPFGRHIAYGSDPSQQVVVSWQVPAAVTAPFVRIGTVPGDFSPPIPAEVRALTSQMSWQHPVEEVPPNSPKSITQYYLHARIDRLLPNTTYYYVVGHEGYDPAARLGEMASFRTAPAPGGDGTFSFTAFGDQGVGYNAVATSSLIAGLDPAFHLAMGDLSYALEGEGGHPEEDQYDARLWDSFFVQNEPVTAGIPWMMALGNHEMEGWYSEDGYGGVRARFTMPDNAWNGSTCIYSWRYQNVGLISLDGNDVCYNSPSNLDYTKGKQLKWLGKTLAAFRADPTIDFIVVYCHQCTYSTCHSNGAELGAQKDWAPLFDKYQVDLVLNGHNHIYERTDPIRAGKAVKKVPSRGTTDPVKDGTTYITAGGGGGSVSEFPAPDTYLGHETSNDSPVPMKYSERDGQDRTKKVTWSRVRFRGYSLVAVDVIAGTGTTPPKMDVRAISADGTLVDQIIAQRS
ncbi:purple acid phosphatase family protein [Amycolatopsis decaplanina]|uniref:Putative phosphodiesterase n=1 Tax=Amycolatopsis decaplanina DSM 44594 TaxID=1284240 RepID=M2Z2Y5_9PSEU|nr:metallophosphoesterase family protein [Amycolatopsis decaplanina]EME55233.1 putative phosphodiesterase [Amycolatopsis decaplanina DSM 44594]